MDNWKDMQRKSGGKMHPDVPRSEKINSGEYNVGAYNLDTLYIETLSDYNQIKSIINSINEANEKIYKKYYVGVTETYRPEDWPDGKGKNVSEKKWSHRFFYHIDNRTDQLWSTQQYINSSAPFFWSKADGKNMDLPINVQQINGSNRYGGYLYKPSSFIEYRYPKDIGGPNAWTVSLEYHVTFAYFWERTIEGIINNCILSLTSDFSEFNDKEKKMVQGIMLNVWGGHETYDVWLNPLTNRIMAGAQVGTDTTWINGNQTIVYVREDKQ